MLEQKWDIYAPEESRICCRNQNSSSVPGSLSADPSSLSLLFPLTLLRWLSTISKIIVRMTTK